MQPSEKSFGNLKMSRPKVFVILLHLRDIDGLQECLASLGGVSYGNFEVILVHNGLPNAELEKKVSGFSGPPLEIIYAGENTGFAKGNNIGIRRALNRGADYVLLLNDDTVVSRNFLDILVAEAEKDPLTGMLGPEVLYYGDRERISFMGAKFDQAAGTFSFPHADELCSALTVPSPVESDYVTGCALLVKKSLLEKIGLLDERFFLYWEDSDWGLRAAAAGFRSLVVPAAKIWHKISVSSGGNDSPLKIYHKTKSHLLFAQLHSPRAKKTIMTAMVRDVAWLIFKCRAEGRFTKAAAYLAGAAAYFIRRMGPGPAWLWKHKAAGKDEQ
jgi:GT2 family glycosyltransferase